MILEIQGILISSELFDSSFVCDLNACKGACCVEGDRGAPLDSEELPVIDGLLDKIRPYMLPESITLIEKSGYYLKDEDDDYVTNCHPGGECVFAVRENGILACTIEKAWNDGVIGFRKPQSCHLYPIRISKTGNMEAVNYHKWHVCNPACELGNKFKVPLFRFLKEALIRKYTVEWYGELEDVYAQWEQNKGKLND
jgi:hypothetical protein